MTDSNPKHCARCGTPLTDDDKGRKDRPELCRNDYDKSPEGRPAHVRANIANDFR